MKGLTHTTLEVGVSPKELIHQIQTIIQSQLNGRIYIRSAAETWHLDFRVGRLVWASGGSHRFRRWQRSLKRFCPNLCPTQVQLREKVIFDHWEYLALTVMIKRQQINREDAIALAKVTMLEVLFDILQHHNQLQEISHTTDRQSLVGEDPLALFSNAELFSEAQENLEAWQAVGLGKVSPNLAPTIRDLEGLASSTSPKTYRTLRSLLKGRLSFRDLSLIMSHDLSILGRSIINYLRRELVSLKPLPDLESPFAGSSKATSTKTVENLPLVFCIDDSPQICYIMEETLKAAGYRCQTIQDSIQALPNLIRHKPDLIFLDLIMPVANGYEICSQIRRVASLRKIPVVILTGNDGVVDRVRAKAVGATDFMSKPVDPERVAQVVSRHIQAQAKSSSKK